MSFWVAVRRVMREADVILLVLDARMPLLSMNREVKEKAELFKRHLFYVFNKIDLVPRSQLEALRREYPDAFFISTTTREGIHEMRDGLEHYAGEENLGTMKVGIVGYPNVGKSSLINALTGRASAHVSNVAGTTKGVQWIKAGGLKLLDSPGVIPYEDKNAKLGMLGAKNPEKLKSPHMVAYQIIGSFLETKNKAALEAYYKLKLSDDPEEIFFAIGKKRGLLSKGGIVDETKTAINIVRDWQRGKIKQ